MQKTTLLFAFLICSVFMNAQNIHRVDPNASGSNDGSSWENAFTNFQNAINTAAEGDEIWVKEGLYLPEGTDTTAMFTIDKALNIFGGFAGTELTLEDRVLDNNNPSILSGDLLGDDDPTDNTLNRLDNSRHVVYVDSLINGAVGFDGFTFAGGNTSVSDDLELFDVCGGAIISYSPLQLDNNNFRNNYGRDGASVALMVPETNGSSVNNCIFQENTAVMRSAGLYIRYSYDIDIENCTFTNNETARGAIYPVYCENVTISNCTFSNNQSQGYGGALFSWNNVNLNITDCLFENNIGASAGVAYFDGRDLPQNTTDNLSFTNCEFNNNTAFDGAGGALLFYLAGYTMTNCSYDNNVATGGSGGALYNGGDYTTYVLSNSSFNGNTASFGGAIATYGGFGEASIDNCDFEGNEAMTSGGAVTAGFYADVSYTNSFFNNNSARFGGASFAQNDSTSVYFENCTWTANTAEVIGGAISSSDGISTTIVSNEFTSNSSLEAAGAIAVTEPGGMDSDNMGELNITKTSFLGNNAGIQGGAIYISNVDSEISNSYFLQNSANDVGAGGALSLNSGDTTVIEVMLLNSTLASNLGELAGGISQYTDESSELTLTVQNTILDNQGTPNYAVEAGTPEVISGGGNFITDESLTDVITADDLEVVAGDAMYLDIFAFDLRLDQESPCVDAGVETGAPLTDFDGNERVDQVDIGAFENQKLVSVKERIEASQDVSLYPNPAQDFSLVSINNESRGAIKLALFNTDGKLIWELNREKTTQLFEEEIKLNNLEAGTYMLRVLTEDMIMVKPLIKQ